MPKNPELEAAWPVYCTVCNRQMHHLRNKVDRTHSWICQNLKCPNFQKEIGQIECDDCHDRLNPDSIWSTPDGGILCPPCYVKRFPPSD